MRKLSLLLTLCSLLACRSPQEATQTIIKISATDAMQQRIKTFSTQVSTLPNNETVGGDLNEEARWPVKRTFVPETPTSSHKFRYVFTALAESNVVVSTLAIETEVVPGATRYVYVLLSEDCVPANCDAGVCDWSISAAGLRTSPGQAQELELKCEPRSPTQSDTSPETGSADNGDGNIAGSSAPIGQNTNTSTGTAAANAPAADGGTPGAPNPDAGPPSTTAACTGNPCGQGDCILNDARATGYDCQCKSGFEPNEEGSTCVTRDDCAKPDKGGCEDICTTLPTGEAECSCEGPNRWLKADKKQCAQVQEPHELSTSGGSLSRTRPQVAFDRAGNGVVVWTENSAETGDSLWTARYRADTKQWEPATRFQRYTTEAADLHLALDGSGSGVLMWTATVASKRQLWAKRYRDGAFVATTQQIDRNSEGDVLTPALALDATGDGLAVWTDMLYPRSKLRVARYYASSDTFQELVNVLDAGERFVFGTSVAVNNLTGGLVAWTDMNLVPIPDAGSVPDFTNAAARSSRVETSLSDGLPFTSESRSTSPDVALDEQGNGVAVWMQGTASSSRVFHVMSRSYEAGTAWSTQRPYTLSQRGGAYSAPRVVIGVDGTSFAVWRESTADPASTEQTSAPLQTFGAMRTAAGFGPAYELGLPSITTTWNDIDTTTWTPETTVTLLDMLQPTWSTAVGPEQTGFIAGASFTTSVAPVTRALWLQRIGSQGEPTQLIPLSEDDTVPSRPSPVELGMNANGDGAVVWDQQVDGRYHVFVNLLD